MKYLKRYNESIIGHEDIINTIEDILVDIEDEGFITWVRLRHQPESLKSSYTDYIELSIRYDVADENETYSLEKNLSITLHRINEYLNQVGWVQESEIKSHKFIGATGDSDVERTRHFRIIKFCLKNNKYISQ